MNERMCQWWETNLDLKFTLMIIKPNDKTQDMVKARVDAD